MKRIVKYNVLIFLMVFGLFAAQSQVKFSINAPAQVAEGSQFRVVFSVNENGKSFSGPNFKGFSVRSGPNQSQSSSTQIYNGQATSSIEISYSYIIEAGSVGKYTIGAASIVVDGKTYRTNAHIVEVVKGSPQKANQQQNQQQQATAPTIAATDLFVRAIPSKNAAYQGEEVLILYKLYYTVPIVRYGISKLPSSDGFWSNELTDKRSQPRQYTEAYNNRNYNVADLRKIAVYAQKSGKLTINPLNIELVVQLRQQRQRKSFWDDFFSDPFQNIQNIEKKIFSNKVAVQVLPFPEPQPAGFSGVVGNYTVSCAVDKTKAKTNDAISLTVSFSGKGNLSLIDAPKFEFPSDFESYDPKIKDRINTSLTGLSGTRTFEYLLIPRNPGKFDIKSIDIVTFNPSTKSYSTYKTPAFSLDVEKGNGYIASSSSNQKDINYLNSDVRFIKISTPEWGSSRTIFLFSFPYFMILLILVILFFAFVFYYRKQITMRQDLGLMRNKRASKLARKRLSKAQNYMKAMKRDEFYIEISQVIWGYVADKCNISTSLLSMDTIRTQLSKIEVEEAVVNDFVNLLNDCEFARFAPGDPISLMNNFYERAFSAIITLEKQINSNPKPQK